MRDASSGEAFADSLFGLFYTVQGLFDVVQDAIDSGADEVSVTYDPDLHYPTEINIDLIDVIDEELLVVASDLEPTGLSARMHNTDFVEIGAGIHDRMNPLQRRSYKQHTPIVQSSR